MTNNSLLISLRTLTPIWTGGIGGEADRLHATGIIGSLRWWYEAIVRGLGGQVCDPIEHSCLYDKDLPNQGLCDACRVFGTTGWARRFRLIVSEETNLRPVTPWKPKIAASRPSYIDSHGIEKVPKGWFFNSPPLAGSASIKIIATDKQFQTGIVGGLIQFLADWASIGARPQMGFGVVELIHHQDTLELLHHLQSLTAGEIDKTLPSLQNMFFTSVSADTFPTKTFPKKETFNLKYDLRRLFATNNNLRHFIMGEAPQEGEPQGAKVMMSYPYNNDKIIRVWGWIPEEVTKFGVSREKVIQQIHTHLKSRYTVDYWREFNSERDTEGQYSEIKAFLKSLLERRKA